VIFHGIVRSLISCKEVFVSNAGTWADVQVSIYLSFRMKALGTEHKNVAGFLFRTVLKFLPFSFPSRNKINKKFRSLLFRSATLVRTRRYMLIPCDVISSFPLGVLPRSSE
jgi:hypothetical protein